MPSPILTWVGGACFQQKDTHHDSMQASVEVRTEETFQGCSHLKSSVVTKLILPLVSNECCHSNLQYNQSNLNYGPSIPEHSNAKLVHQAIEVKHTKFSMSTYIASCRLCFSQASFSSKFIIQSASLLATHMKVPRRGQTIM